MMNRDETNNSSSVRDMSKLQMALLSQLLQAVTTMHHIDEMFQWLAYAIMQHFNVPLTQFWTNQINPAGRLVTQLRTIVRQDPSLPEQTVVNDQMAYLAQSIVSMRRSYMPQPVETLFPSYQTTLLKRYGLNYCAACFTSANVLLPPPESVFAHERPPVPLAMTTLLFVRQSFHPDVIYTIGLILDQAITMAGNRGLLQQQGTIPPSPVASQYTPSSPIASQYTPSPPASQYTPPPPTAPQLTTPPLVTPQYTSPRSEPALPLDQLVPRRRQDADFLLSNNPFASTTTISDKKARRLHAAIDDHTNIADLCKHTGMNMQEIYIALQMLLEQHRIELYEPGGQLARTSLPRM